jgi:hypothetical protein
MTAWRRYLTASSGFHCRHPSDIVVSLLSAGVKCRLYCIERDDQRQRLSVIQKLVQVSYVLAAALQAGRGNRGER